MVPVAESGGSAVSWWLSPSGWPMFTDSDYLGGDLSQVGFTPLDPSQVQSAIDAYNNGSPPPPPLPDFVTVDELQTSTSPARAALGAAFVPFWEANETVAAGTIRMAPDGSTIKRTSDGTTSSTYDATEQSLWTTTSSGGSGGGAVASVVGQTGAVTGTQIAADPALKAAYAARDETPSLEELERVTLLGTVNATVTRRLGPASFDERIGAVTLAVSTAVAASDTDYWTVAVLRLRAGANPLTVASRTTKATDGEAFTADQGWNFDATQWLETGRYLRKGDVLALAFTKTGAPADLTDVSVAVRYEPGVLLLVRDSFSRTDGTALTTTDSGQAWTNQVGTWTTSGETAVASGPSFKYAFVDVGVPDFTASVRVAQSGHALAIMFRTTVTDPDNNEMDFEPGGVYKTTAGVTTQLITGPSSEGTTAFPAGSTLSVVTSGPLISAFIDGNLVGTASDTYNQDVTTVGLYIYGSDGVAFDDFEVAV